MLPFDPASLDLGTMPPEQVATLIGHITTMMTKAPWVTRRAEAGFQVAIDHWDRDLAVETARQFQQYMEIWHTALSTIPDPKAGVAELLPLEEHGVDLLRAVDIGELTAMRGFNIKHHIDSVTSLLRTLRVDWITDGGPLGAVQPQKSALIPLPPVIDDPHLIKERTDAAIEALLERMKGPRPKSDPIPGMERLVQRIRKAGATPFPGPDVKMRHQFYEFLAHRFAYMPSHPSAPEVLEHNGYRKDFLPYRTESGLNFFVMEPLRAGFPPVVVFRGTEPDDLKDIKTDLEFQIGADHFASAQELGLVAVLKALNASYGRVDVTGHSLGGALSQLAALTWPEYIGDVVTFQAPGLTRLNAFRGEAARRKYGANHTVTHYIGDADLVHMAGQRHLPGTTVLVTGVHLDRGPKLKWGMGHSDMLLADAERIAALHGMHLSENCQAHTLCARGILPEHPTTTGSVHEAVRATIAIALETTELLLSPNPREALSARGPDLLRHAVGEEGDISRRQVAGRLVRRVVTEFPRAIVTTARTIAQRRSLEDE